MQIEGKDRLPLPAGNTLPSASQDTIICPGCKEHIAGSCFTWFPPGCPGPFLQNCFPQLSFLQRCSVTSIYGVWGCSSPDEELEVPFIELCEVPACPFLQPVEVPLDGRMTHWFISTPGFVLSANFLRAHSAQSFRS